MIELCLLRGRRLRETFGAGEEAIQMVEAAILRIEHDDMLDPRQVFGAARCTTRGDQCQRYRPEPQSVECPHLRSPSCFGATGASRRFARRFLESTQHTPAASARPAVDKIPRPLPRLRASAV